LKSLISKIGLEDALFLVGFIASSIGIYLEFGLEKALQYPGGFLLLVGCVLAVRGGE